jgi:hypothetical protein
VWLPPKRAENLIKYIITVSTSLAAVVGLRTLRTEVIHAGSSSPLRLRSSWLHECLPVKQLEG